MRPGGVRARREREKDVSVEGIPGKFQPTSRQLRRGVLSWPDRSKSGAMPPVRTVDSVNFEEILIRAPSSLLCMAGRDAVYSPVDAG